MFSKTRLRVLCVYFPALYLLSPEISKLYIWNCNLTCLSDLEIVLGGKLAKPLALENVILVRFCQLCVAVLSHLGHLQANKISLEESVVLVFIGASNKPAIQKEQTTCSAQSFVFENKS